MGERKVKAELLKKRSNIINATIKNDSFSILNESFLIVFTVVRTMVHLRRITVKDTSSCRTRTQVLVVRQLVHMVHRSLSHYIDYCTKYGFCANVISFELLACESFISFACSWYLRFILFTIRLLWIFFVLTSVQSYTLHTIYNDESHINYQSTNEIHQDRQARQNFEEKHSGTKTKPTVNGV